MASASLVASDLQHRKDSIETKGESLDEIPKSVQETDTEGKRSKKGGKDENERERGGMKECGAGEKREACGIDPLTGETLYQRVSQSSTSCAQKEQQQQQTLVTQSKSDEHEKSKNKGRERHSKESNNTEKGKEGVGEEATKEDGVEAIESGKFMSLLTAAMES